MPNTLPTNQQKVADIGPLVREFHISLVMAAMAATLWFWLIPYQISGPDEDKYFARLIALAMASITVLLISRNALALTRNFHHYSFSSGYFTAPLNRENLKFVILIGVWAVDIIFMKPIGFYIMSPLAVFVTLLILGARSPKILVAWSLVPLVGIYLIFEVGLNVELPKGILSWS